MPDTLDDSEVLSVIESLRTKAHYHRQTAAVYDVLVEELEDSLYES